MKRITVQKIKRISIAALAAVLFVSSELPAYGAVIPQEAEEAEPAAEEKERETFDYPQANVYEGETELSQDKESGQETPEQVEGAGPESGQPGVLGEEPEETEKTEQPEPEESEPEEQEPGEDITLLAPDLSEEALPYAEKWEEPVETGMYYKTYRNPDGSFRTICTSTPNLYKDEKGEEHPIDNTLILAEEEEAPASLEEEGVYVNTANSMKIELPAVIKPEESRGITIEEEGLRLVMVPAEGLQPCSS